MSTDNSATVFAGCLSLQKRGMQTVEVFAKTGCSREPRKIPNESPFSAELWYITLSLSTFYL